MIENTSEDLITVDEFCESLLIGKNLAYRLLGSGQINCFKINRIWKIPRSSVCEYIDNQCRKRKSVG